MFCEQRPALENEVTIGEIFDQINRKSWCFPGMAPAVSSNAVEVMSTFVFKTLRRLVDQISKELNLAFRNDEHSINIT